MSAFRQPNKNLLFPTSPREAWLRRHWVARHTAWLTETAAHWNAIREARSAEYFARKDANRAVRDARRESGNG